MFSLKYSSLVFLGVAAYVNAFAPVGIALRAASSTPATCVFQGSPEGSYRDEQGNLRDKNGKILQAGTGRGSEADIAAMYFAQKKKAEEDAAIAAAAPKITIDMSEDDEFTKWKEEKAAAKAAQEAEAEAKMQAWLAAAAAKKAASQ